MIRSRRIGRWRRLPMASYVHGQSAGWRRTKSKDEALKRERPFQEDEIAQRHWQRRFPGTESGYRDISFRGRTEPGASSGETMVISETFLPSATKAIAPNSEPQETPCRSTGFAVIRPNLIGLIRGAISLRDHAFIRSHGPRSTRNRPSNASELRNCVPPPWLYKQPDRKFLGTVTDRLDA